MTTTLTDVDLHVRDAVLQRLAWDPQVDASRIGVTARRGVVTLTGYVDSYADKLAAERAAKRIGRVRAVANDVQVTPGLARTDTDIATDAVRALELRTALSDTVQIVVHNGHVTLTGAVRTLFQRAVAEKALRYIAGIKDIANRIRVAPSPPVPDLQSQIALALRHDADVGERGLQVTVSGDTVTLKGLVRSCQERESAEAAAIHAPGVAHVDNQIVVGWPDSDIEAGPL